MATADGDYTLSAELLTTATGPQIGGSPPLFDQIQGCRVDPGDRADHRRQPYRHVLGFEAGEISRSRKMPSPNNAARPGWYPWQDWGVGRAEAIGYLAEVIGVEFARNACTFCPFTLATEKGRACTRHAVARGRCGGHRFQDCHCTGSGVAAACSTVSTTLTQVHLELINDRVGRHGIG